MRGATPLSLSSTSPRRGPLPNGVRSERVSVRSPLSSPKNHLSTRLRDAAGRGEGESTSGDSLLRQAIANSLHIGHLKDTLPPHEDPQAERKLSTRLSKLEPSGIRERASLSSFTTSSPLAPN